MAVTRTYRRQQTCNVSVDFITKMLLLLSKKAVAEISREENPRHACVVSSPSTFARNRAVSPCLIAVKSALRRNMVEKENTIRVEHHFLRISCPTNCQSPQCSAHNNVENVTLRRSISASFPAGDLGRQLDTLTPRPSSMHRIH
jgi:hypothetical protein